MASSMLDAAAAAAASTSASSAATGEMKREEDACTEEGEEEALNNSLRSCANDPDFAVICTFLQKFSKYLGLTLPNFKHLQEWLTNTDEVSDHLRDLHIKLLRKTRKTVHEKSWESALSKFCFTYSAQDAWEIERFGYKKSSLKVKLRIFRELLESQFQRNAKFRAQILTMSADLLRSQPIGRDRLGHNYYFTQDDDCNLRIYQEHLDEEIWQVVATTREELVNLISRLRGNEVVLPSTDIGVDEDTSSSNSCAAQLDKPPPPEEQDDSQEEEARIPNLRIKLSNNGKLTVSSPNPTAAAQATKRSIEDIDKSSPRSEELNIIKKARPSLLDVNRAKKPSRYEKTKSEGEEEDEEDEDDDDEDDEELSIEEEDIDSAAAEEDENEEKEIEDSDGDTDEENDVGEAIEEPELIVRGEGCGKECEAENPFFLSEDLFGDVCDETELNTDLIVGEAVEEEIFYVFGVGSGAECLVGNGKTDGETATATTEQPTTTPTTPKKTNEPQATFFFGEPGCLKLSPIKQPPKDEEKLTVCGVDQSLDEVDEKIVEKSENVESSEEVKSSSSEKVDDGAAENKSYEECVNESNGKETNETIKVNDVSSAMEEAPSKLHESPDKVTTNGDDADCSKEQQLSVVVENVEKCVESTDDGKAKELDSEVQKEVINEIKNEGETEQIKGNNEVDNKVFIEEKKPDETKESVLEEPPEEKSLPEKQDKEPEVCTETEEKVNQTESGENSSCNEQKTDDNTLSDKERESTVSKPDSTNDKNTDIKSTNTVVAEKDAEPSSPNGTPTENISKESTKNEETKNTSDAVSLTKTGESKLLSPTSKISVEQQLAPEGVQSSTLHDTDAKKKLANLEITATTSETPDDKSATAPAPAPVTTTSVATADPSTSSSATTSSAIPSTTSSATPSSATPSSATTSNAIPSTTSSATPSSAIPSSATPSSATPSSATPSTTPAVINRKRRLEDMPAPSTHRLSTSESEVDLQSEQQDELTTDLDLDPAGKRFKMRPKITNTDLRKKVEAEKGRVEETTSSSGEEDARRRRKIITPRRQIERCVKNLKVAQEAAAKREGMQAQAAAKLTESTVPTAEENNVALNLTSPTTLVFPVFPAPATSSTAAPIVSQSALLSPPVVTMPPPGPVLTSTAPAAVHATPTIPTTSTSIRQKPTLAEIIEKKLKKSSETAATTTVPTATEAPAVIAKTSPTIMTAAAAASAATPTELNAPATISPPKKSPITKPLKKNLLTQIRQEESDEDSIPRKRTISDASTSAAAATVEIVKKLESFSSEEKERTPERKTPERRVCETKVAERASAPRKTPDRKTPERQRKRRSSEEVKSTGVNESEGKKEMKYEALVEQEAKVEVIIKKEKSPSPAEVATIGRRSSRRTAATVIYAELPQPKRTRAGAKTTPTATPKKACIKEEKTTEDVNEASKVVESVSVDPIKPTSSKKEALAASITETVTTITSTTTITTTAKMKDLKSKAKQAPKATKPTKKNAKKELGTTVKEEPKPASHKAPTAHTSHEKSATPSGSTTANKASTIAAATATATATAKATSLSPSKPAVSPVKSTSSPAKMAKSEESTAETTPASARGRGARKQRDVDATNIIETIDSETPVRQSRRIAQQKIREEAERRKLEEIALRTMKQELKKKKKAEKQTDPTVVEPSEPSSSSSEESEVELKKKVKKKCPGKDGWSSGSEEQEEPEEEDEPPHYSDPGSPLFRSDHEFSPESDLEDESQVVPMKRARTARKEDAEEGEDGDEEACQKCGKSDHPEWILLCDNCDKGYHCSCLSPVLFYIPEGDWYCPPCQQEQLIVALEKQLKDFDDFVEHKRLQEEENKRLAAEAERVEQERLENEKLQQKELKERKKQKKKSKRRGENGVDGEGEDESGTSASSDADKNEERIKKRSALHSDDDDSDDDKPLVKKGTGNRKSRTEKNRDSHKRRRGDGRSRRRAAARGIATRRRQRNDSDSGTGSGSPHRSGSDSADSRSGSGSSSSSSLTDSDDEPIYKLRKRRQINVSYRLNEYDDLINSALKKEMDELAGAGNLGRGKDISTIMEADKEEKARQRQLVKDEANGKEAEKGEEKTVKAEKKETEVENDQEKEKEKGSESNEDAKAKVENKDDDDEDSDDEVLKRKAKPKLKSTKKKSRKLTTLDISSEEDNASDEDFKTSSFDDEEEEDTSVSVSTDSDSSLEEFRRRGKKNKKQRKAARRAVRERRKDRRFVVDESDEDEEEQRPKSKKKRKDDSDYTESETDSEASENLEDVDSADLCDDSTSESDGAWYPSKRKKQRKGNSSTIARKSPKMKKQPIKKVKRVEYSDDDISESEEEEDDDDDDITGGKGSGKQPRSQPLKPSNSSKGKGKGKGKGKTSASKKKKKLSEDEDSFSDSEDSTRRTRGRRYAYLEDFDDESSDGGIKPGVKRPDTPPEERQKFIQRQEEIKRMLAEKNAEGAKLAATPRLTPIKADGEKDKRSPAKLSDSLSTVPLSVIRQAKVLDADYLQRKGESVGDSDNVDEVDEFDDADLPDDFPEDMDEDTIARMVEEEEELTAAAAARELPPPDEVLRTPTKHSVKPKEALVASTAPPTVTAAAATNQTANTPSVVVSNPGLEKTSLINPSLAALSQMPGASSAPGSHHMSSSSGLQEPMRKRLPMPTLHPPLLRHQFPPHGANMPLAHLLQRHPSGPPPTHLLQSALNAPLGQPLNRSNFPPQHLPRLPAGMSVEQMLAAQHLMSAAAARHNLPPTSQPLPGASAIRDALASGGGATSGVPPPTTTGAANKPDAEPKPRGRRKKITPLRDTLQKQQTAAAVTAATTQSDKIVETQSANNSAGSSVIKSPASATPNAPPPQLYKQHESPRGPSPAAVSQASVITRMPQLPASATHASVVRAMSNLYPGADVARFFAPPTSLAAVTGPRPPPAMQRQREGPGLPGLPPHGMRQSYGPPPPLRGSAPPHTNHGQPPQSGPGERPTYPAPGDHHVPGGMGASMYAGPPPPARHSTSHLNPYRPPIYGNPAFVPRGPHVPNLRVPVSSGPEFPGGPRTYSPYGYYPPPPPLTTPHGPPMQRPPTSSPAPISRASGGPPPPPTTATAAATASIVSAASIPPAAVPKVVSSVTAITTPTITNAKANTVAATTTTAIIAKPSSVIVSAPSSSAANASLSSRNISQKSPIPTPTITQTPTTIPRARTPQAITPTTTTAAAAAATTAAPPPSMPTRAIATETAISAPVATIVNSKGGPVVSATVAAAASVISEQQQPPRKKLTTLETYAAAQIKSPLVIAGESSGSRSSPGGIQADGADDSCSAQGTTGTAEGARDRGEGQASEFSGLVSYFSSQHDDYNT